MKSSSPCIIKISSQCCPPDPNSAQMFSPPPRCTFQQFTYQHAVKAMKNYAAESVLEIHIFSDVEKMFQIYTHGIMQLSAEVYE